jgi:Short C-terminal domain
MNSRRLAKIPLALAIVLMVVGGAGFTVLPMLNAFVLDKYDAYGDVPIPGSTGLQLPAGKVSVSFHTEVISGPNGGGLPVPQLDMDIYPPSGVPKPVVTESVGGTTTINNDSHIRLWVVQVPAEGTYTIKTDGQVNGFISPSLAFGKQSPFGWSVWPSVGVFVVGLVGLIVASMWLGRIRRKAAPAVAGAPDYGFSVAPVAPVFRPTVTSVAHQPNDEGVRLERLKTIAALRDSGALTDAEFETEKRRILEGR